MCNPGAASQMEKCACFGFCLDVSVRGNANSEEVFCEGLK